MPDKPLHVAAPWEQQTGESTVAFEAFQVYRDDKQRPRSLTRTAHIVGKNRSLMQTWSRVHSWVERVQLHDRDLDRQRLDSERRTAAQMGARHAGMAATTLDFMIRPAIELVKRWQAQEAAGTLFKDKTDDELWRMATQAGKLLQQLVNVERLARGHATELIEVTPASADSLRPTIDWLADVYATLEDAGIKPPKAKRNTNGASS